MNFHYGKSVTLTLKHNGHTIKAFVPKGAGELTISLNSGANHSNSLRKYSFSWLCKMKSPPEEKLMADLGLEKSLLFNAEIDIISIRRFRMNCPHCNMDAPDNNYRCPHCGEVLRPNTEPADFIKQPGKKSGINANIVVLTIIVLGLAVLIYTAFFKGKGKNPQEERTVSSAVSTVARGETAIAETGSDEVTDAKPTDDDTTGDEAASDETGGGDTEGVEAAGDDIASPEAVSVGHVINAENPGQEIDIKGFIRTGQTTIFDFYSEYCPPCRRISPLLERLDSKRQDIVVHKVDINRPGVRGIDWASPVTRQYNLSSIPHFKIYDSSGELKSEGQEAYSEIMRLLQSEGII
jgi:thiol-disulfide isomerase/thioredoxin